MLLQRIRGVHRTLRTEDSHGRRWVLIHWMDYPNAALTSEDWKEQKAHDEDFVRSFHVWWDGPSGIHAYEERKARDFIEWFRLDFQACPWDRDDPAAVLKDAVRRKTVHAILESEQRRGGGAPKAVDTAPYDPYASTLPARLDDVKPFEYKPRALTNDTLQLAGGEGTPGNNQAQNKQFKAVVKALGLSRDQAQELHQEISRQGLGYHEIMERARDLFGGGR